MALQEAIFQQRKLGTIEDTMLLLQVNTLKQCFALARAAHPFHQRLFVKIFKPPPFTQLLQHRLPLFPFFSTAFPSIYNG